MNELELFAGAGGGILGSMLLGHRTVCAVEYDAYARSVLLARQNDRTFPPFPVWDDVRTFDGKPWRGIVDVVSGGFPCQAYSTAAAGKNNADDLWPEMRRVVADVAPRYVFAENVKREAIESAADDLEAMGYVCKPPLELSAKDMGADHDRPRCWLLAYADNESELLRGVNAEMAVLQDVAASVWESYPGSARMANGVAHRTHRLKASGNGQVPVVRAAAWELLFGEVSAARSGTDHQDNAPAVAG